MAEQHTTTPLTTDVALANAARILYHAEGETNLASMERLDDLANTWISIAALLHERDQT